jgi:hypothetical protein
LPFVEITRRFGRLSKGQTDIVQAAAATPPPIWKDRFPAAVADALTGRGEIDIADVASAAAKAHRAGPVGPLQDQVAFELGNAGQQVNISRPRGVVVSVQGSPSAAAETLSDQRWGYGTAKLIAARAREGVSEL